MSILLNNGDGTFAPATNLSESGRGIAIGDLDGDLDLDLAVVDTSTDEVLLFANDGNAGFSLTDAYPVGLAPWDVEIADLDGDGDLDLAVTERGRGTVEVFLNTGGVISIIFHASVSVTKFFPASLIFFASATHSLLSF